MKPSVFLDRDGVICEYVEELCPRDEFVLRPGSAEGIRLLNDHGFLVFVATNQPNIAKAKMTWDELMAVHAKMESLLLKEAGAHLDKIYFCPHRVGGSVKEFAFECHCRKPEAGMLFQAFQEFPQADPQRSLMVGDTWRDVGCAQKAGIPCLGLFGGGGFPYPKGSEESSYQPLHMFNDLLDAAKWIIQQKNFK
jgi:D-glycero-D-manno-heptose 1,7-bisphosphate phosphatase